MRNLILCAALIPAAVCAQVSGGASAPGSALGDSSAVHWDFVEPLPADRSAVAADVPADTLPMAGPVLADTAVAVGDSVLMLPGSVSAVSGNWLDSVNLHSRVSFAVNGADLLTLVTLNLHFSFAVSQHWAVKADVRYNPFTYHHRDAALQTQLRHQTYALGARWWPWYVNSGFFVGSALQYREYNRGGFHNRLDTEEGDAFGLALEAGYAFMLSPRFNLEVGLGGWGGKTYYKRYACSYCGRVLEKGTKWFLLPNELILSFVVVL